MNIFGTGVDIVNIKRISKLLKNNNNAFTKRLFTQREIKSCKKKDKNYACYAKKFAAKEAFSKAIGTGVGKFFQFKEIEVLNNLSGAPNLKFTSKSLKNIKKIIKKKKFKIHLSLADDDPWAVASVIILTYE